MLAPVSAERASYAPLIFFAVVEQCCCSPSSGCAASTMAGCAAATRGIAAIRNRMRACRTAPKASASRSGQIFEVFMRVERETPDPFDASRANHGASLDKLWFILYEPIARRDELAVGTGWAAAAWPHPVVPDLHLRYPDLPSGFHDTMSTGILLQLAQTLLAILLAPLLMGWVNQCRAWLQGAARRRSPSPTAR